MTKESTNKKNLLKILSVLDEGNVSRDDLLCNLNIKTSTFYKHLHSIKKSGFKIKKEDGNYEIIKFKKALNFAKYELGIFAYLILLSNVMLSDKKAQKFNNAVLKMIYLSDKKASDLICEKYMKLQKILKKKEANSNEINL